MKATFFILFILPFLSRFALAQNIAYIHGDVAPDGSIPSGSATPFHQMRLEDTGKLGCSQFREMVEREGYTITPHYDRKTKLTAGIRYYQAR